MLLCDRKDMESTSSQMKNLSLWKGQMQLALEDESQREEVLSLDGEDKLNSEEIPTKKSRRNASYEFCTLFS